MRKKTLSLLVVIGAISFNSVFASSTYQQVAEDAITLTKAAGNYDQFTISTKDGVPNSTIWFLPNEINTMEGNFKLAIYQARTASLTGTTGFITYLQQMDNVYILRAYSGDVDVKSRAMSLFYDKLYTSFFTIRNSPTQTINISSTPSTSNSTVVYNPATVRTFIEQGTYKTTSNKSYTIRKSSDNRYWFSKTATYGFKNLNDLYNYLEYQNRIIYQAPNGRMYGIFKYNGSYRFNRDEGSISSNSRASVADVKAYINQHNQPVTGCISAKERKCVR